MDNRTRTALEGSIAKWQAIVDGTGEDHGTENCPLCLMFFNKYHCSGCPVKEYTGESHCELSPYHGWDLHHGEQHNELSAVPKIVPGCKECKRLAQAELDFLKSLLPDASEKAV
jgi:hypothetical protein